MKSEKAPFLILQQQEQKIVGYVVWWLDLTGIISKYGHPKHTQVVCVSRRVHTLLSSVVTYVRTS